MAVLKQGSSTETEGDIKVTNGDWQALKRIATSYGLTDESDVITFAIGVLNQSGGKGVYVRNDGNEIVKLIPSQSLKEGA